MVDIRRMKVISVNHIRITSVWCYGVDESVYMYIYVCVSLLAWYCVQMSNDDQTFSSVGSLVCAALYITQHITPPPHPIPVT